MVDERKLQDALEAAERRANERTALHDLLNYEQDQAQAAKPGQPKYMQFIACANLADSLSLLEDSASKLPKDSAVLKEIIKSTDDRPVPDACSDQVKNRHAPPILNKRMPPLI